MANTPHASTVPCPLNISGITINFKKSKMDIEFAEVRMGELRSVLQSVPLIGCKRKKRFRWTFSPPWVLSHKENFSLHMDCLDKKVWYSRKTEDFSFNPDDIFCAYGASQGQDYTAYYNKIKIDVQFSGIQQLFLGEFRILVIGKTGVGKSSLINDVFGVEEMIDLRGASIDHEFISPQNDKFVLHGGKGFGLRDNLETIRDFIDRRRNMSPEHQLHAVWLCLQTPRTGRRLLDTRTKEFLTLKRSGILGNVPVIVVLTKYDRLVDHIQLTLDKTFIKGLSNEKIKELARKNAETELQNICIRPLEKFAGSNISHAAISTNEDYEKTLTHLVQIAENCVTQHSASKAAVMISIRAAQRVDPELKIKASFEIAKKRYRKTFSCCCAIFKKPKMWDFLHALHDDIINVWNFYDLHHYLDNRKFRESISKMIEVGPTKGHRHFFSLAPVIRHIMSYIVNLTLVSQTLYFVSGHQKITRRAIKLAVSSYLASPIRAQARVWIQTCDRQLSILDRVDRDSIVGVIRSHSINATQRVERRENTQWAAPPQWTARRENTQWAERPQWAEPRQNIHMSAPIHTPATIIHPNPTMNYHTIMAERPQWAEPQQIIHMSAPIHTMDHHIMAEPPQWAEPHQIIHMSSPIHTMDHHIMAEPPQWAEGRENIHMSDTPAITIHSLLN